MNYFSVKLFSIVIEQLVHRKFRFTGWKIEINKRFVEKIVKENIYIYYFPFYTLKIHNIIHYRLEVLLVSKYIG